MKRKSDTVREKAVQEPVSGSESRVVIEKEIPTQVEAEESLRMTMIEVLDDPKHAHEKERRDHGTEIMIETRNIGIDREVIPGWMRLKDHERTKSAAQNGAVTKICERIKRYICFPDRWLMAAST